MISRRQTLGILVVAAVAVIVIFWLRGGGGDEDEVTPLVAVHVQEIQRATLRRTVTAYGTVDSEPALDGKAAAGALITPFVEGVVVGIDVVEGRRVSAGTVLVRLDSRMAQVAVDRARSQADVAEQAFQRQEKLLPIVLGGTRPGHEIEHPMAVVILGGLITSTLLNLLLLPGLYLRYGKDGGGS